MTQVLDEEGIFKVAFITQRGWVYSSRCWTKPGVTRTTSKYVSGHEEPVVTSDFLLDQAFDYECFREEEKKHKEEPKPKPKQLTVEEWFEKVTSFQEASIFKSAFDRYEEHCRGLHSKSRYYELIEIRKKFGI